MGSSLKMASNFLDLLKFSVFKITTSSNFFQRFLFIFFPKIEHNQISLAVLFLKYCHRKGKKTRTQIRFKYKEMKSSSSLNFLNEVKKISFYVSAKYEHLIKISRSLTHCKTKAYSLLWMVKTSPLQQEKSRASAWPFKSSPKEVLFSLTGCHFLAAKIDAPIHIS